MPAHISEHISEVPDKYGFRNSFPKHADSMSRDKCWIFWKLTPLDDKRRNKGVLIISNDL